MIEVIDDTLTGEVLLDEALKMMKSSEKMSVGQWIDLMSGMQKRSERKHTSSIRSISLTDASLYSRRNLEPDENRLPAEAST